jgi:hypothetical protein
LTLCWVFGIAVLGAVFSAHGSYASGSAFVSGLAPAVWVGGAAVAVGAAAALLLPRMRRATVTEPTPEGLQAQEAVRAITADAAAAAEAPEAVELDLAH